MRDQVVTIPKWTRKSILMTFLLSIGDIYAVIYTNKMKEIGDNPLYFIVFFLRTLSIERCRRLVIDIYLVCHICLTIVLHHRSVSIMRFYDKVTA